MMLCLSSVMPTVIVFIRRDITIISFTPLEIKYRFDLNILYTEVVCFELGIVLIPAAENFLEMFILLKFIPRLFENPLKEGSFIFYIRL